ncbi:chromate efflux transporter [Gynuella sunshinyii]|uniref:Chromate transport protein ChrA n=1 Tax=Gynuella sunshinyii YC6258 TaxID=1445510 RepID=A0A0C5VNP1_9GAMM|nr:chromate efflux transporter [Gynuella sunshinyii]AJQ95018.1 chromate transport protein ChrA [Gynuella sunshinyii YC6258]
MTQFQPTAQNRRGNALEVLMIFFKLGLTSFGGPIAHLGYFHKELVTRRRWVSDSQFSQLLTICQFLPGPASSQLGFTLGLMHAGWLGALAAFVAFTLPSALILTGFAAFLPYLSDSAGAAVVHALKLVAVVIITDAVLTMLKNLCPDTSRKSIAIFSACLLLLTSAAWVQWLVLVIGALAGVNFCRGTTTLADNTIAVGYSKLTGFLLFSAFLILLIGLPIIASHDSGILTIINLFYQAGALVFGGGHVVLPLLQDAVVSGGWMDNETFLAGYGAAQAVPGPMFTFSAYLGAFMPTSYHSTVTAGFALLAIFLPGLLLVAAALPTWQLFSRNALAASAIAGINASVVGLLGAALYDPVFVTSVTSAQDFAICIIAFGLLRIWHLSPLAAIGWCVLASLLPTAL